MPAERCQIDELVLRIGGAAPADPRALAAQIARRLAERLRGTGRAVAIPELRVDAPAGLSLEQLADAIADAIARAAR